VTELRASLRGFSFVNRIALLLGVQMEQGFEATCGPLPDT
jgi:hypothetical protein